MTGRIASFIRVLKEAKNPFRLIVAQLLVKSGFNKFFIIRMNGYKINFSKSALAITFFANPHERHDDENFLRKVLKQGNVYVDVGANIGTLTLAASTLVGNSGKVIAIEAHTGTFKILKANVDLNNCTNTLLINSAVGNKKGTAFFSNINSDDQNKVLLQNEKGIEVPMETLDNLLIPLEKITLLKIDVEGYEKFVLEGASQTLLKTSAVYFESWEKHFMAFDYSAMDILKIFTAYQFTVYEIIGNNLHPVTALHISGTCQNLLAVKDSAFFCAINNFKIIA